MKKIGLILIGVVAIVGHLFAMDVLHSTTGVSMAIAALATQKIVFMTSLKEEYDKLDTWLKEATDLSSFVADGQTLVFPEGGADPAVYKNRETDVDSVEPAETVHQEVLDYYDSQNYKIRNIHLHALPFDKIQYYTKKSAKAILKKEIYDAAYTFTPADSGDNRIVIATTGDARNGLKMMTLNDVITLARACDNAGFPEDGRNLVLPSDMWWDLVQNNDILKAQLSYQQNTGVINPSIVNYYGFKIHKSFGSNAEVAWDVDAGAKAAQGAVITGDIVPAGFIFCSTEVYRADGKFEMFMTDKSANPTGRAYEFGFAHRHKSGFDRAVTKRYTACIYQAKSA
jgi:hypothetical protein